MSLPSYSYVIHRRKYTRNQILGPNLSECPTGLALYGWKSSRLAFADLKHFHQLYTWNLHVLVLQWHKDTRFLMHTMKNLLLLHFIWLSHLNKTGRSNHPTLWYTYFAGNLSLLVCCFFTMCQLADIPVWNKSDFYADCTLLPSARWNQALLSVCTGFLLFWVRHSFQPLWRRGGGKNKVLFCWVFD